MNKVCLMGRLTRDPELRYAPSSGVAVARYALAVDRSYTKQGEKRETDFINIVTFGKSAEFVSQYFKKGKLVAVTGKIQTGSYTDKEGRKIYTTDIVADEQFFAESKKSDENIDDNEGNPEFMETEIDERNLPF
jgi:single-strand DNA-binding protein